MDDNYTIATSAPYEAMQAAGATAIEVAKQASSDGLSKFQFACVMRDVLGLNLRESLAMWDSLAD